MLGLADTLDVVDWDFDGIDDDEDEAHGEYEYLGELLSVFHTDFETVPLILDETDGEPDPLWETLTVADAEPMMLRVERVV
jgi:hypothetical protein